jgi:glycosyltransferase involved in cell wall biosynthesis
MYSNLILSIEFMDNLHTRLISIITPLWNETESIDKLSAALSKTFQDQSMSWEWIAVDDGSKDDTVSKVTAAMRNFDKATLVCLSRNFGQQAAYRAGLEHASGNAVVFLDADLQDPPDYIPQMIAKWQQGVKLVVGCRKSRPEKGLRGLLLRLFHEIFSRMTHQAMPKNSGTFGLIDRVIVERLKTLPERNLFLPALRSWVGYKQDVIWYDRQERKGTPKQTYAKLFNYAWAGITSFSEVPLRCISWLGLLLCLLGLGYAFVLLASRIMQFLGFFSELRVLGFTTLAVTIMGFGGIQLLCLGIIGEYLAKIYTEVKHRPLFVVDKIITSNDKTT